LSPKARAFSSPSSRFALFQEVDGRTALGGGLLQIFLEDVRPIPVPDPKRIDRRVATKIVQLFDAVADRPLESVFAEMERPDQQALDKAVFEAVGLDSKRQLRPLYDALAELVRERTELGRTRGTERKTRSRGARAEREVAEAVLDEVVPDGPRRFPDDFLSPAATGGPKTAVDLPDEPLVFENTPMFMGVHVKGGSYDRHVRCPAEGKFLLYAQQAGHKVAQIPEKTVEVTRTVANYEKYLRELHTQLYEAYYRRTLDTRTAARLTQAAFDRFHLPSPEGV